MAVYRCEVKRISRSAGQSAVAAAAYRSATRLRQQENGHHQPEAKLHDYRRRALGVAYREVMAGKDAPEWARDRAELWNAAERAENRRNSVTAREILLSLPHELDDAERIELTRGFAERLIERYGVAVDLAIHRPDRKGDQRNHHAHVMMTTRRMGPEGLKEKTRELDDRITGPQEIEAIREIWEREQNLVLERTGKQERVSRLSNEARGIDREPQAKLGEKFTVLGRQGIQPRAAESWQEVARRRRLKKDENRPEAEKRHALERQALARKYQRAEHSRMRQNMAKQREEREKEKQAAVERALLAAGQRPANQNGPATLANVLMRDTSQVQQAQQEAARLKKDEDRKQDEQRAKQAEVVAARAALTKRQDELRKQREAKEQQNQNPHDLGRLRKPPKPS